MGMKIKDEVLQICIVIKVLLITDACKKFGEFLYIFSLAKSQFISKQQAFTAFHLQSVNRLETSSADNRKAELGAAQFQFAIEKC